jgi:hypothetical protein
LFKDEVPDLVIRKRAWTQCMEEFNPSMWASLHCIELLILHTNTSNGALYGQECIYRDYKINTWTKVRTETPVPVKGEISYRNLFLLSSLERQLTEWISTQ